MTNAKGDDDDDRPDEMTEELLVALALYVLVGLVIVAVLVLAR